MWAMDSVHKRPTPHIKKDDIPMAEKSSFLAAPLLLLFCFGCSSNAMDELPFEYLEVEGLKRNYAFFAPESLPQGPMPLLVAFHGGGMMYEEFPQQVAFQALAESEGFIIAYPRGYDFPGNEGTWQLNTAEGRTHDIAFISAMIDHLSERYPIDGSRIYGVGYSLGSMFSYEVACHMSDRFTAIASYAGTMPISPDSCEPERFAPIMHIHGASDGIISYSNSWGWKSWDEVGDMMNIPSLLEYWNTKYLCQSTEESVFDTSTHTVYDDCSQNARVEHHRIEGHDHDWPSAINGTSTHRVIWEFLSEFEL